jgi:hypothetical protein
MKKLQRFSISFIVLGAMLLAYSLNSCNYQNEEKLYPKVVATCDTMNVTFSGTIDSIINTKCSGAACHSSGGGSGFAYNSYAGVKVSVDDGNIMDRVILKNNVMPPASSGFVLTDCEIQKLRHWLYNGAPNN